MKKKKCLLFGFGNIGRQDDALGIMLAEKIGQCTNSCFDIDQNFQLNAEDALTISEYDIVIFADACVDTKAPFCFQRLKPDSEISFSTHAMHPKSILALCGELFDKIPRAYLLTMPGYEWEFNAPITPAAQDNLDAAFTFIDQWGHTLDNLAVGL